MTTSHDNTDTAPEPTRVLLGVSGGIAAYKAPDLVRRLSERGADVQVVLTRAAASFVTPLSLQAVSGRPVRSVLLEPEAEAGMDHIALARWADRVLVAPATAHLLARLAHGLADDLLTTLLLASEAPVWLAPAMNHRMWLHPATADNLRTLQRRGCRILGPASGAQACGEIGPGRMLEPIELAEALLSAPLSAPSSAPRPTSTPADPSITSSSRSGLGSTGSKPGGIDTDRSGPLLEQVSAGEALAGVHVLVTAGPTREPIDPVRYVGNRSSGKMGYALASAMHRAGARVTLVSGPTCLDSPRGVDRIQVSTAAEMHQAVMQRVTGADLFIAAAAVADYRPSTPRTAKMKKGQETLTLELVRNPDILADVAALPSPPFMVGFAAETDSVESYAARKLESKGIDMIAANQVGGPVGGFESDENALVVLWRGGECRLAMMPKPALAEALTELIAKRYAPSPSS
jgi:phosphopantothenoylcysteine decarboxylase/phosphopantothenate--cysteine ligase